MDVSLWQGGRLLESDGRSWRYWVFSKVPNLESGTSDGHRPLKQADCRQGQRPRAVE